MQSPDHLPLHSFLSHPVHRVIWQRFPNKMSSSEFAKRLIILTFHFILKVPGSGGENCVGGAGSALAVQGMWCIGRAGQVMQRYSRAVQ